MEDHHHSKATAKGNAPKAKNLKKTSPNKRRGKRRKDRSGKAAPRTSSAPPSPQLKVTLRRIGQVEKFGTMASFMDLITQLVQHTNENYLSAPSDTKLELDVSGMLGLVEQETAVQAEREAWQKSINESNGGPVDTQAKIPITEPANGEEEALAEANAGANDNGAGSMSDKPSTSANATVASMTNLEKNLQQLTVSNNPTAANGHQVQNSVSTIATRVLYAIPPRNTRRRGEKPGVAYLVLTTPPLAATVATADPVESSLAKGETAGVKFSSEVLSSTTSGPKDYSRDIARRRLMLSRAVDAMIRCAEDDAKSKQDFAGCVVEESLNGKTWKSNQNTKASHRSRERVEGTLEESADYKAFLERSMKEKEEISARPKPPPGGAAVAATTSASTAASTAAAMENGQPVAALVLHLRNQHEAEKQRKKAKAQRPSKIVSKNSAPQPTPAQPQLKLRAKESGKDGGNAKKNAPSKNKKRTKRTPKKSGSEGQNGTNTGALTDG